MGGALSAGMVDLARGLEWAGVALLVVGSVLVLVGIGLDLSSCWPVGGRRRTPGGR
jgi:hypothetical protein